MRKIIFSFTIMLCVIFIALLILSLFKTTKQLPLLQEVPTPVPVNNPAPKFNALNYDGVFSDPKVAESVEATLKNPTGATQDGVFTVVSFPTDVQNRSDQVYAIGSDALYITKEVTTDNTSLSDFVSSHPKSFGFQLFDKTNAGSGFTWTVFPQDGVAYLANNDYGYAIRVLYFPATNRDDFLKTVAPTFNLLQVDPDNNDTPEAFQP